VGDSNNQHRPAGGNLALLAMLAPSKGAIVEAEMTTSHGPPGATREFQERVTEALKGLRRLAMPPLSYQPNIVVTELRRKSIGMPDMSDIKPMKSLSSPIMT
jgi:hypothetical protein